MGSNILMTCGGFALAVLGCIVAWHNCRTTGFFITSTGVIMMIMSLPKTED